MGVFFFGFFFFFFFFFNNLNYDLRFFIVVGEESHQYQKTGTTLKFSD